MRNFIICDTLEELCSSLQKSRNCMPFRFSGKWYACKMKDGFKIYRTKSSAVKNAITEELYILE